MRVVTRAFKLPVSEREGGIRAKLFDFKVRKRKRAHLGAIIVFAAITIANRLPAAPHFIAGNKKGGFVVGVTIHETVNIAAVPSLLLRAQNGANLRNDGGLPDFWSAPSRISAPRTRSKASQSDFICPVYYSYD